MKIPVPGLLILLSSLAGAGSPPDVRLKGEAGMDLRSSAGAPWQWQADDSAAGKQTLAAGAPAHEGGTSWLELNVRGPDKLYFKSRTAMAFVSSGITMSDVFPRNGSFLTSDILYDSTMEIMPLVSTTNDVADWLSVQDTVFISSPDVVSRAITVNATRFPGQPVSWTPLSLLLDGNEVILSYARSAGPAVFGCAECLGSSGSWTEQVLHIPAGRHTVRWQYAPRSRSDLGAFLDGVRLENGNALKVTQPRSFTFAAGQPGSGKVRTNLRAQRFTAEYLPPGLSLNGATGVISGTSVQPGRYEPVITARTARGDTDKVSIRIDVEADAGAALDEPRVTWTQGGDSGYDLPCTIETTTTTDGLDAVRINAGSWLETVITGPDRLSFSWMASGGEPDVTVLLDGTSVAIPNASQALWHDAVVEIPAGKHRVRFQPRWSADRYLTLPTSQVVPSGSFFSGTNWSLNQSYFASDNYSAPLYLWSSCLVDNVRLGNRPRPHLTTSGTINATADSVILHRMAVTDASAITATGLPEGLTLELSSDGQHVEWQGVPKTPGTYPLRLTATGPGGIAEVAATLDVAPPIGPALEAEGLVWRTDSAGSITWRADAQSLPVEQNYLTWNGMDAVRVNWQDGTPTGDNAWIETEVTGPDVLHFRWLGTWAYASGSVTVLIDDLPVKELTRSSAWQSASIEISAGSHTIRWQATSEAVGAVLDEVRLASDARAFILEEPAFSFTALRQASKALKLSRAADVSVTGELPHGLTLSINGTLSGRAARSGSWTVELVVATPAGTTTRAVTITVAPACLPDWLAAHDLTGAALTSDADGDRVPLLAEFGLGSDPRRAEFDLLPKLTIEGDLVFCEFSRGDYDAAGVHMRVEYSPDMRYGWIPLPCEATTDESGRPIHRGSLHLSGGITQESFSSGFFRIRADVPRVGRD